MGGYGGEGRWALRGVLIAVTGYKICAIHLYKPFLQGWLRGCIAAVNFGLKVLLIV